MQYDPSMYWENRLQDNFNLQGVGHICFDQKYNYWLYQAKVRALRKAFMDGNISLDNRNILDVGCGTGFFVDLFHKWGGAT